MHLSISIEILLNAFLFYRLFAFLRNSYEFLMNSFCISYEFLMKFLCSFLKLYTFWTKVYEVLAKVYEVVKTA